MSAAQKPLQNRIKRFVALALAAFLLLLLAGCTPPPYKGSRIDLFTVAFYSFPIPGLSYYFYIVDGEQMYVYYRSGDYMVEIESKGRYDCIREAYENTYGKYYGNN